MYKTTLLMNIANWKVQDGLIADHFNLGDVIDEHHLLYNAIISEINKSLDKCLIKDEKDFITYLNFSFKCEIEKLLKSRFGKKVLAKMLYRTLVPIYISSGMHHIVNNIVDNYFLELSTARTYHFSINNK
jgi:hypothetical protein